MHVIITHFDSNAHEWVLHSCVVHVVGHVTRGNIIPTVSHISTAVQQERKPPEPRDRLSLNVAASTQKIYIRKDFNSPSTAIPTFDTKVCVH